MIAVERCDKRGGVADNLVAFHESPVARIVAVITVVTEHEVMILRHRVRPKTPQRGKRWCGGDNVRLIGQQFSCENALNSIGGSEISRKFLR